MKLIAYYIACILSIYFHYDITRFSMSDEIIKRADIAKVSFASN